MRSSLSAQISSYTGRLVAWPQPVDKQPFRFRMLSAKPRILRGFALLPARQKRLSIAVTVTVALVVSLAVVVVLVIVVAVEITGPRVQILRRESRQVSR